MAGFFDDEDVVRKVPSPVQGKKKEPSNSFFDEEDTVAIVQPVAAQPQPQATPTTETPAFFDKEDAISIEKPTGFEGSLSREDFDRIAAKYNVPAEELRSLAPYYGAKVQPEGIAEGTAIGLKSAAGLVGRTAGLGIPQFAYKKFQDENVRKALDELTAIGNEQQGIADTAAEIVMPGSLGGAATRVGRLAKAAGLGGVIGTTTSREGEELQGAATGAAFGTALGSGAELLGKVLSRSKAPAKEIQKVIENPKDVVDLEKATEKVVNRTQESEKIIKESGLSRDLELTDEQARRIVAEQKSPEFLQQLEDKQSLLYKTYANKVAEEGTTTTVVQLESKVKEAARDIIESRALDFAEELTGKRPQSYESAIKEIKSVTSRQGKEAIANKYTEFVRLKQAEKAIEEGGIFAGNDVGFAGKATNFVSDNQFVLRGIDRKYKLPTSLEETLRDANKKFNRSTFQLKEFMEQQGQIFRNASKLNLDKEIVEGTRVYDILDGKIKPSTEEEKRVADQFRQYFKGVRDFVNKKVVEKEPGIAPLSIPFRDNYVPKLLKNVDDLIPAIQTKIKEAEQVVGSNLSGISSGDFATLIKNEGPVKDLYKAATLLDNTPIKSGAELEARLKRMTTSRSENIALETEAKSALERKDVIPDFMLEKNLYKLARKYTDNTLKHLYLREPLDKMRYQAKVLSKLGADTEAEYVRNIIRDVMGVRAGTAAEAQMQSRIQLGNKLQELADKQTNPISKQAILLAKAVPDIAEEMIRQIYPNVLGSFAIRPIIQNTTQAITKTAPELGGAYGYTAVLRTAARLAFSMQKEFPRLLEKSRRLGNLPAEFTREGEAAIAEGIRRTAPYRMTADALAGAARVGMYMFTKAEELNRVLVTGIAETMARDLSKGVASARKSLQRFPKPIQKRIEQNPGKADEVIAQYLNDATMYNYNRVSMSEFGRTMGPIFSAFSKWPTATAGEIVEEFRSKGATKGSLRTLEKFLAPYLLLQSFDALVLGEENIVSHAIGLDNDELTDRKKKLFGTAGLSQSAPIGSLPGVLKGEIFTPPAADAFIQTAVVPLMEGKSPEEAMELAAKGMGNTLMLFVPTMGWLRLLFDDLPTYLSGERPEGTNALDRVITGIEETTK